MFLRHLSALTDTVRVSHQVCVSGLLLCRLSNNVLTLTQNRGFAISEFATKRPETFVKRTFARWRALPLRRDLTRVRHDAMGFARARELAPVCLIEVSLGP
jgi:hypothetical protein